ncbi:MAG: hypothetical protein IJ770_01630 [Alphaproteobacteria bacterium]|nr:hypothetical protein [Alphaproteobacteria bacterium]
MKYTFKEKLEIAECIVTIIMFFMAVWGTIISFEEGFWHKLNHIVTHYHESIDKEKNTIQAHLKIKTPEKR